MLTDEAAELLIDHQINTLNRSHVECLCGWYLESTPKVEYAGLLAERFYREHLAELIASRVRAARAQERQQVIDELHEFLPEWNYPPHVIAAISLELKDRANHIESSQHG